MADQHDPQSTQRTPGQDDDLTAPAAMEPPPLEPLSTEPVELPVLEPVSGDETQQLVADAAQPIAGEQDETYDDEPSDEGEMPRRSRRFLLMNAVPSWMISLAVHTLILIVLGYIVLDTEEDNPMLLKISSLLKTST